MSNETDFSSEEAFPLSVDNWDEPNGLDSDELPPENELLWKSSQVFGVFEHRPCTKQSIYKKTTYQ